MVKNNNKNRKLDQIFFGPYKVIEVAQSQNVLKVRKPNMDEWINVKQIKKTRFTNPEGKQTDAFTSFPGEDLDRL